MLSLTTANPIIVPDFHGQIYFPFFRAQQYNQQQQFDQQPQDQAVERSDQESQQQNYSSDYGGYSGAYDGQENSQPQNDVAHENESQGNHDFGEQHQQHDYSAFADFNGGSGHEVENNPEGRHDSGYEPQHDHQPHYVHSVPVSEHVEVTRPVAVPVYKEIGNSKGLY